jgi:tryptophanyl-tRNA synthetase
MSKSYDNCIYITEPAKDVEQKVSVMVTDPARVRRHDPGDPEKCSVWSYHKVFTDSKHHEEIHVGCTTAGIGCRDCKKLLASEINRKFEPARARRAELEQNPDEWRGVLDAGNKAARARARQTMERVRERLHLYTE